MMPNRYLFNELVEDEYIVTSFSTPKKVGGRVRYGSKIYTVTSVTGVGKSFTLGLYHEKTKEKLFLTGNEAGWAVTIVDKE